MGGNLEFEETSAMPLEKDAWRVEERSSMEGDERGLMEETKGLIHVDDGNDLVPPRRRAKACLNMFLGAAFVVLILSGLFILPRNPTSWTTPENIEDVAVSTPIVQPVVEGMGYTLVGTLPKELLPEKPKHAGTRYKDRRLIFIGDVHGSLNELKKLLKKVEHNRRTDHVVFLGDMISRGKHSPEVVDLAIKLGASCVRGNHEDRVLHIRKKLKPKAATMDFGSISDDGSYNELETEEGLTSAQKEERKLARLLTVEQAKYLSSCPIILKVGSLPYYQNLVAVHGGLVPNLPLKSQDPYSVMNMRAIDPATGIPSAERDGGVHWAKVWNEVQKALKNKESVVYGHYAYEGLDVRRWSTGLDGNCVRGGSLNALVLEGDGKGEVVSVRCRGNA